MAVLPESMNKLDPEDTGGSLSILENYIRYMGERIEFSMRNMTRTVSAAGVSSAEIYILLTAAQNDLSTLKSELSTQSGRVTDLAGQVSELSGQVTGLQGTVTANGQAIAALQTELTALKEKVAVLETPPETQE